MRVRERERDRDRERQREAEREAEAETERVRVRVKGLPPPPTLSPVFIILPPFSVSTYLTGRIRGRRRRRHFSVAFLAVGVSGWEREGVVVGNMSS